MYLQTPRDRAIHALVFFSPFLAKEEEEEERKKKKRRKKIKLCSPDAKFAVLRSLINAVKQAQVTNWRVICIVIVTQAFARRNGEGAAGTKGGFASMDLTENSGKETVYDADTQPPTLNRRLLCHVFAPPLIKKIIIFLNWTRLSF